MLKTNPRKKSAQKFCNRFVTAREKKRGAPRSPMQGPSPLRRRQTAPPLKIARPPHATSWRWYAPRRMRIASSPFALRKGFARSTQSRQTGSRCPFRTMLGTRSGLKKTTAHNDYVRHHPPLW